MFPHESGIVMQRGVEMGMVLSSTLVAHSLFVLNSSDPLLSPHPYMDRIFEFSLLIRVISAIPRPYLWMTIRSKFVSARSQPTPQQVTQALMGIYNNQTRLEKILLHFYYGWLLVNSLMALLTPYTTALGIAVWRHLLLNFAFIVLHRLVCIVLFYYLVQSDMPRGIGQSVIESESTVVSYVYSPVGVEEHTPECSICYVDYSASDEVRILKCGHDYHKKCVDEWLTRHRNRCPICLHTVGDRPVDLHPRR